MKFFNVEFLENCPILFISATDSIDYESFLLKCMGWCKEKIVLVVARDNYAQWSSAHFDLLKSLSPTRVDVIVTRGSIRVDKKGII